MRPHPLFVLICAFLLSAAAPASAQMAQGQATVRVEVAEPGAPVAPDHLTVLDVNVTLFTDIVTATTERHAQVELKVLSKPSWLTATLSPGALTVAAQPQAGSPSVEWPGHGAIVLLADQGGSPGDVGELVVEARVRPRGFLPETAQTVTVEVVRGEGACDAASAQALAAQSAEPEASVPGPALAAPLAAVAAALVLARRRP